MADSIRDVLKTVQQLRSPEGCPWDLAQTHQTLRPYLIEEAYEVLDVLDEVSQSDSLKDPDIKGRLIEELGDLLLQVLLHSEIADQEGHFSFAEVAKVLNEKLIRRHPHVFGNETASNAGDAYKKWEELKAKEKERKIGKEGLLSGLPRALPALQKAGRVIEKVSRVGFQWKDLEGPLLKVKEELQELEEEIQEPSPQKEKIEDEMGDLLFSLCNLSHHLKIEPENALRRTLEKFRIRFSYVEEGLRKRGKNAEESTLEEMDGLWQEAKKKLR